MTIDQDPPLSSSTQAASAEETWILACLRSSIEPHMLAQAEQIADRPGFDWSACLVMIYQQKIAPLLYCILVGKARLPAVMEQALAQAYMRNQSRNAILLDELQSVVQVLHAEQLPFILLKGASLLHDVYLDAASRPMGDFDLLVHREHLQVVFSSLEKIGYQFEGEPRSQFSLGFENEVLLVRPGPLNAYIEIHWNLIDSPFYQSKISVDWFWQTARQAWIETQPCQVLGYEAQVLHLCAHLMLHHSGKELLWLHDIAVFISKHNQVIDWQAVISSAQEYNLVIPTQNALKILTAEWAVPIPAAVLTQIENLIPSAEENRINTWLTATNRPVASRFWADLRSIPGWRMRLLFALDNLFPSPVYMRYRYKISHPLLLPYYYLYRWMSGLRSAV